MDWGLLIIMILVIPFITFLPAIFVAGLGYGLYQAIRNVIRERKMARKKLEGRAIKV
jgi:hypothetical protein